jgi:hypothetical protein
MPLECTGKSLLLLVCIVFVVVGVADVLHIPAFGISGSTTYSVTISDTIHASATASVQPWYVWDPFSSWVVALLFSFALLSGAALFWVAWKAGRSLRFSFTIGTVTFVLAALVIRLVLGPASQVLIPSLRGWASGSWEDGVVLLVFIVILTVVLLWLLAKIPRKGERPKDEKQITISIQGDRNIVQVGTEIKETPEVNRAPNLELSNLSVDPRVLHGGGGPLTLSGQVINQYGNPTPALIQIYGYDGGQVRPVGSPFPSGSDGRFATTVAATPPIVFVPVVIGPLVDTKDLEDEFKTLGNPLQTLLQEAERKAVEILARRKNDASPLGRLELATAVRIFVNNELKNFDDFYRQKQSGVAGFPITVAAPLTTDNDLNKKLWGAVESARRSSKAMVMSDTFEKNATSWMEDDLVPCLRLALEAIKARYGKLATR